MWNSIAITRNTITRGDNDNDLTEFDQTMIIFETQNGHSYYATKQISTIDPSDAATTYPAPVFLSFTPSSSAPYSTMAEEDFNPAGYNVIFVMLQTS